MTLTLLLNRKSTGKNCLYVVPILSKYKDLDKVEKPYLTTLFKVTSKVRAEAEDMTTNSLMLANFSKAFNIEKGVILLFFLSHSAFSALMIRIVTVP